MAWFRNLFVQTLLDLDFLALPTSCHQTRFYPVPVTSLVRSCLVMAQHIATLHLHLDELPLLFPADILLVFAGAQPSLKGRVLS